VIFSWQEEANDVLDSHQFFLRWRLSRVPFSFILRGRS
jgi:hypothetical protein